jgi:hypothetical protein
MKKIACCLKWKDISNSDYTISHPYSAEDIIKEGNFLYDKRRVRYCPECGKPLYTYAELFMKLFS